MPLAKQNKQWIESQETNILTFVKELSSINSWSHNKEGLEECYDYIIKQCPFESVSIDRVPCKNTASTLRIKKQNTGKLNLLFCIHIDTVYPPSATVPISETDTHLIGPGVADAKGGIAVLLWTLRALEKETLPLFNWTILINPDEEIGSNSSKEVLKQEAKKHDFGFIFEPSLPNGNMVSERKGSYNGVLTSKGKSAHAGRHIEKGINAITPLCTLISKLSAFCESIPSLALNIGTISGGTAINQVPEQAKAEINLRSSDRSDIEIVCEFIKSYIKEATSSATLELNDISYRPPKLLTKELQDCIKLYKKASKECSISIDFNSTGGVCDGNILQNYGLPTIDTLGPVGEFLHTSKERVLKSSFCERIQITTLYIQNLIQQM
jgi:glutamate carboxypeptidase